MERVVDEARSWQRDAFQMGKDARFFVCQAPGGSGKSKLQCILAAHDVRANPAQKQLIVVPQSHISRGFSGSGGEYHYRIEPGGKTHNWRLALNCCGKQQSRGWLLKEFLLAPPGSLGRWPTAVATHMALVMVWSRLSEKDRCRAIRNLTLRIDEAHHVSGVLFDGEASGGEEDLLATRLGDVCRYVVNSDDGSAKLHFTTATFYRGDRATILSDAVKGRFVTYSLPWDEHWPTLGIEELTLDYLNYRDDPVELVTKFIAAEPARRHLVIVPPMNQKYRVESTVEGYLTRLRAILPRHRILDLVTPATQERNKQLLHALADQYHVVIACRLFNEGTDWVICDRLHNTDACERSMTLAVQRFFRPLRKHPDKKIVRLYHYLPEFMGDLSDSERRKVFSDRSNAILAGVICNLELRPVSVPVRGRRDGETPLQCLYGPEQYRELVSDTMQGILTSLPGGSAAGVLAAVREKHGTPDGVRPDDLDTALQQIVRRASDRHGVKLSVDRFAAPGAFADIDIVVAKSGLVGKYFGTVNIDNSVVRRYARYCDQSLSTEQVHQAIRDYASETGKRPTNATPWMKQLGMSGATLDRLSKLQLGMPLAKQVELVLGVVRVEAPPASLEDIRRVIRLYFERDGTRLTTATPWIPELGIKGAALQARLAKFGSSIAQEVGRLAGSRTEVDWNKVRRVIQLYHTRDGIRLTVHHGYIPELEINSCTLDQRLKSRGSSLVEEVDKVMGVERDTPLEDVHRVIRLYHERDGIRLSSSTGLIPELGVRWHTLNARLMKKGTTLGKEVEKILGPRRLGRLPAALRQPARRTG